MINLSTVIAEASELFSKYGIRSVTMEDLSRSLGISKKTIYNFVDNKKDLVDKAIEAFLIDECKICDQISEKNHNAIEEMVEIGNYVSQHLSSLNSSLVYDLKKYYRNSWQRVERHRLNYVYSKIKQNIEKGKAQGLYRSTLNASLVAKFYINQSHQLISEESFPASQYDLVKVYWEYLRYHFNGICSQSGKEYMENNLKRAKSTGNA